MGHFEWKPHKFSKLINVYHFFLLSSASSPSSLMAGYSIAMLMPLGGSAPKALWTEFAFCILIFKDLW